MKILRFLFILLSFSLIISCASRRSKSPLSTSEPAKKISSSKEKKIAPLKKPTAQAVKLRDDCLKMGISSQAAKMADSLFAESKELLKDRKEKESYFIMCLASAYYTLAISEDTAIKKLRAVEEKLEKARSDIEIYKEALRKVGDLEKQ